MTSGPDRGPGHHPTGRVSVAPCGRRPPERARHPPATRTWRTTGRRRGRRPSAPRPDGPTRSRGALPIIPSRARPRAASTPTRRRDRGRVGPAVPLPVAPLPRSRRCLRRPAHGAGSSPPSHATRRTSGHTAGVVGVPAEQGTATAGAVHREPCAAEERSPGCVVDVDPGLQPEAPQRLRGCQPLRPADVIRGRAGGGAGRPRGPPARRPSRPAPRAARPPGCHRERGRLRQAWMPRTP